MEIYEYVFRSGLQRIAVPVEIIWQLHMHEDDTGVFLDTKSEEVRVFLLVDILAEQVHCFYQVEFVILEFLAILKEALLLKEL